MPVMRTCPQVQGHGLRRESTAEQSRDSLDKLSLTTSNGYKATGYKSVYDQAVCRQLVTNNRRVSTTTNRGEVQSTDLGLFLYVSTSAGRYSLMQLCSKFGKISKLDYLFHKTGPQKGKPRGYAFVEYSTKEVC